MSEIMQRGPITCSIACPDDFIFNYTGGVYTDMNNSTDVDHDVEVVGWGHEDGKDFWHVRNSWGKFLFWSCMQCAIDVILESVLTGICTTAALLCSDPGYDVSHNIMLLSYKQVHGVCTSALCNFSDAASETPHALLSHQEIPASRQSCRHLLGRAGLLQTGKRG